MRKSHFFLILFSLSFTLATAQKAKVQSAASFLKFNELEKAKTSIDEAMAVAEIQNLPKAWYYKGKIYRALYKHDTYGYLCDRCLEISYSAFKKLQELEPQNEWRLDVEVEMLNLYRLIYNRGIDEFNAEKYSDALKSFEMVQEMQPGDTTAIINSAFAADRAGNVEKATQYYTRLISLKYPDDKIYLSLSNLYKQGGDKTRALLTVQDGRKQFPDSLGLILSEINLLLSLEKNKEASEALDAAIRKDPNNQSLYLALGSTYDNLANPKDETGKEKSKPVNYTELITKAEQAYQRGLELNPDNLELNYNLGALYFNQAAEMANAANTIKSIDEYNKAREKFERRFLDAQPFLEKALHLNAKKTKEENLIYEGTIASLRQLYARTKQMDKYEKIK